MVIKKCGTWPRVAVSGMAAVILAAGVVAPASAANRDGVLNRGEVAMYYNSAAYGYGSFSDYNNSANFGSDRFLSPGSGRGQLVKNNAAAAWNNSSLDAIVYYNSNWDCSIACQYISSGKRVDLSPALKNENASLLMY